MKSRFFTLLNLFAFSLLLLSLYLNFFKKDDALTFVTEKKIPAGVQKQYASPDALVEKK